MTKDLDAVLQSLRNYYAAALPDKIGNLRELWVQQNAEELQKAAHKLKGSGESYGFPEISSICAQIETAAELSDWLEIARKLLDLEAIIKTPR